MLHGSQISINNLGVFDPAFIRVLFAKVEHDNSLVEINQKFTHDLKNYYAEDNYLNFHAHLTLARFPSDEAREQYKVHEAKIKDLLGGIKWKFEVSDLVLYGVDSTQEVEYHQKLKQVKVNV